MLHWIYYQDFVIDYWYLARYLTRSLLGYLQDLTSFFPLEHKKIFKYFCISVNISVLAYDSHRICFTVLSVVVHLVLNSHHDIKKENKQNIIFYSVPENWHLAFYWAAESSENSPSLKQASHFLVPWWLCVVPNLPLTRCDQLIGNNQSECFVSKLGTLYLVFWFSWSRTKNMSNWKNLVWFLWMFLSLFSPIAPA